MQGNSSIPSVLQNLWDNYLKDSPVMLILCGSSMSFIEKEILSEKNPLYGRTTGIYKMSEMSFYEAIQFFPNYSAQDKVTAYAVLPSLNQFVSHSFEDICIQYMRKENMLNQLPFHYSRIGRWWDKVSVTEQGKRVSRTEEIDIMAYDINKEQYILGECKYRNEKTDINVLEGLKKKFPSVNKKCYYYLFSLSGYTQKLLDHAAENDNVRLIEMDIIIDGE